MKVYLIPNISCGECGFVMHVENNFRQRTPLVVVCLNRDCVEYEKRYVFDVPSVDVSPA